MNLLQFLKIILALGLCMRGGGGICADQHGFYIFGGGGEHPFKVENMCSDIASAPEI